MPVSMHPRTKLALLNTLRRQRHLSQGFTLVELMIVVAVIGILSAIALPQYLKARDAAQAGAQIGQAIGLAKECATYAASGGIGTTLTNCDTTGGTFSATWASAVTGLRCLTASSGTTGSSKATITVTSTGAMSCTFG